MYSSAQLARAARNPRKIGRELNRLVHTRFGQLRMNPNGIDIFERDWDNLVILDACRYDFFKEYVDLPGELSATETKGPATYEFIRANFANRSLLDTVYVGANVWYLKLQDEINSEIHDFIDLQHGEDDVEFADRELNVVTPETVTKHAKKAAERYPNKRLIMHYLQPHHPFLGQRGRELFTKQSSSLIEVVADARPRASRADVREAYRENLALVEPAVAELISKMRGKTVVTSDHGEMLGERHDYFQIRDYGHHRGIFNRATVEVPWLVSEQGQRKEIEAEPAVERETREMAEINERLRDLGYRT
jgi:arylsulfatase A-like enzyme